jgi:hypothetical protein
MTRHIVFFALLTLSTLYALIRGGRPEQIGAVTLFAGAWLSAVMVQPAGSRFYSVETGILMTDVVIWGIFLWLSIRSTRFWPLWITALLGAEVLVHIGVVFAPGSGWAAYMTGAAMWSWIAQILLLAATWRHRRRQVLWGSDAPWKT